jgi:protein-tyrosine phosphatase
MVCFKHFSADKIQPRVHLGGIDSFENLPSFITHVVSLLHKRPKLTDRSTVKQLFIRAEDDENQDLSSTFGACYGFIRAALEENNTNQVLIHCRAGKSRSATIMMMYLIRTRQWTYHKAKQYLKRKRPVIKINRGKKILKRNCYKSERVLLCIN